MAKVHEITVWARGVLQDKEARDVINVFAKAAQAEGKHAQAFDNYEDLPDRVLVTVRKYVRLSDEEITHKYVYTNDKPEVVVGVLGADGHGKTALCAALAASAPPFGVS